MTHLIPFALSLDEDIVVTELGSRCALDSSSVVAEIGGNAGRAWAERLGVATWHSVDPRNTAGTADTVVTCPFSCVPNEEGSSM